MPGRLMSIRMTSAGGERNLDAAVAVRRTQQANIGRRAMRSSTSHQIGRVVLDIKQGAQLRVGLNLRLGDCRGLGCGQVVV